MKKGDRIRYVGTQNKGSILRMKGTTAVIRWDAGGVTEEALGYVQKLGDVEQPWYPEWARKHGLRFEKTKLGDQALIPGTPVRSLPRGKGRAKGAQADVAELPLFGQRGSEQTEISGNPRRRRRRRPRRNRGPRMAGDTSDLAGFDLSSRDDWEEVIRGRGGLKIDPSLRADFEGVPFYLKDYSRGIAVDELAQEIADVRGISARRVEAAMEKALNRAKAAGVDRTRRSKLPHELEGVVDPDEWARMPASQRKATRDFFRAEASEATTSTRRTGESRPRVAVAGDLFTLRPKSPFKGVIHRVNRRRRPRMPCRLRLAGRCVRIR
jgi:hypothetical protein